jgi:antitoxin VapB
MKKTFQVNVKGERAYRAIAELSKITGESLTTAVVTAVEQRLDREKRKSSREGIAEKLMDLGRRYAALPNSGLTEDEILDYDEYGAPRNR